MTATPRSRKSYHPGDRAESTGIYRAVHLHHRLPHEITVLAGEIFPPCKRCGEGVRFELLYVASLVGGDIDLLLALFACGAALFCGSGLMWK